MQPQQNMHIESQLTPFGLKVILHNKSIDQSNETVIDSLDKIKGLSDWFDNLSQVQQYIQHCDNIVIQNDRNIQIVHKPATKKSGHVLIAQIHFQEEQKYLINKKMAKKQIYKVQDQEQQQKQPEKSPGQLWVDPTINDFWRLNFGGKWIQNRYGAASILGRRVLRGKDSFTILVYNIVNSISVGIIDRKLKYLMPGKKNKISYQSNKYYWSGAQTLQGQGKGYEAKEMLTVEVDFGAKAMVWRVGDDIRYQITSDMLSDRGIEWVPFVFLGDGGDSFQVTQ